MSTSAQSNLWDGSYFWRGEDARRAQCWKTDECCSSWTLEHLRVMLDRGPRLDPHSRDWCEKSGDHGDLANGVGRGNISLVPALGVSNLHCNPRPHKADCSTTVFPRLGPTVPVSSIQSIHAQIMISRVVHSLSDFKTCRSVTQYLACLKLQLGLLTRQKRCIYHMRAS